MYICIHKKQKARFFYMTIGMLQMYKLYSYVAQNLIGFLYIRFSTFYDFL